MKFQKVTNNLIYCSYFDLNNNFLKSKVDVFSFLERTFPSFVSCQTQSRTAFLSHYLEFRIMTKISIKKTHSAVAQNEFKLIRKTSII